MSAHSALRTNATAAKVASGAAHAGVLQRKCKCGASKFSSVPTCEECKRKPVQRKLSVGQSDDRLELEADRIAEQVLRDNGPEPSNAAKISRLAIAMPASADLEPPALASVDSVLASSGRPLESALRQDMERRFGYDFNAVRIHTDASAERSAHEISAAAYTVGQHVVFGAGQFAPATRAGRHLLAHELTHVVQQSAPARAGVNHTTARIMRQPAGKDTEPEAPEKFTPRLPEPVTAANKRHEIAWLSLRDNVQWHVPPDAPANHFEDGWGLQLAYGVFEPYDPKGKKYSSLELANFTLDALVDSTGLVFLPGAREYLATFIASVIVKNSYRLEGAKGKFIEVDGFAFFGLTLSANLMFNFTAERNFRSMFELESWNNWIAFLRANITAKGGSLGNVLVASANFGDKFGGKGPKDKRKPADERPGWTIDQERDLKKLVEDARKKPPPRPDLPDRLVFYPHKGRWFLNVWVHFDVAGKDAEHKAVALRQGEKLDDLYQRTLRAVQDALEIRRGEDRKRLEAEMPQWAADLMAKVQHALGDEKGTDIPDGMTLALEGRGARVRGPGRENIAQESGENRETQVLLRIWVFRGDKDNPANREQGSVPIFPTTDADKLVVYVRNLAAILREGEHIPDDAEFHPGHEPGEQMLPNFEAMILPLDLGDDFISVAGATNKFSLFLDFDKQYNAIGAHALYVASKLYNQPIYYDWKIFNAPQGADVGKPTDEWKSRWVKLYDHFNPNSHVKDGGSISPTTRAGLVTEPASGFDTGDNDITTRVEFPDMSGDYLVYCRTRHKPIGDAKLKRVSSVAYFPVRLRTREALTTPLVTGVSSAVTAVEANLVDLRARLADEALHPGTLDPTEKAVLEESLKSAEAQKEMLFAQEHGDFVASADAQIKYNLARLKVVTKLKERLPKVLEQAKANAASGTGSTKPTELLADTPDLLTMYLELRAAKMTAAGYEKELSREIEKLRKERERAIGFQNKFKDKSAGGCVYAPEAVFLSKIDGRLYPLKLAVGESTPRSPERVAYTVVDVTLPETSKSYRGGSFEYGVDGHREAIDRAFKKFGDEGMYGDGWIAVRMPVGGPENECATYRPSGIVYYDSEKGILDKVLKILGLLAAFIGVIALTLTGVGMTAAGALIGLLAASMGAAAALSNISDRSARNTLEFDAELVGDILAIVGLGEAAIAARLTTLPMALRGVQAYQRLGKFLALLQLGTGTASILLIPIQTLEDINRIKALGLPADVEREMINQAFGNAVISAVTATSMLAMSRIQARMRQTGMPLEEDYAPLREQAELLALEDPPPPASLREKGWVDADGNWTELAPDPIRQRAKELASGATADTGPHAPVKEKIPEAAQKAVDKVNRGEARIEGKTPGKRRADLGDNHAIEEEIEPNGGVSCYYRSPTGIHVDCPSGLGKPEPAHADVDKPAARTSTAADEAPTKRRDEAAEAPTTDETRVKPREVAAPPPRTPDPDGADPNSSLRKELVDELELLKKKVAANDQVIRDNKKNIADAQALATKALDEYTSTPHGNDTSDAGRAWKSKRKKAGKNLREAEDKLKAAQAITNTAKEANNGHYRRMGEINEFFNPTPETNAAKGTFAEKQGDIAVREGKTEPAPGRDEKLVGRWEWRGSSQKPYDPKKAKPQGLDGGYENLGEKGPRHLAAEFKHDDAPLRSEQETLKWVNDRLDDAVGYNQAERMRSEGYEYWVFRYRPGTKTVERIFMWEWRGTRKRNSRNQWEGTQHYRQRP
jgi:hypothetical protein